MRRHASTSSPATLDGVADDRRFEKLSLRASVTAPTTSDWPTGDSSKHRRRHDDGTTCCTRICAPPQRRGRTPIRTITRRRHASNDQRFAQAAPKSLPLRDGGRKGKQGRKHCSTAAKLQKSLALREGEIAEKFHGHQPLRTANWSFAPEKFATTPSLKSMKSRGNHNKSSKNPCIATAIQVCSRMRGRAYTRVRAWKGRVGLLTHEKRRLKRVSVALSPFGRPKIPQFWAKFRKNPENPQISGKSKF